MIIFRRADESTPGSEIGAYNEGEDTAMLDLNSKEYVSDVIRPVSVKRLNEVLGQIRMDNVWHMPGYAEVSATFFTWAGDYDKLIEIVILDGHYGDNRFAVTADGQLLLEAVRKHWLRSATTYWRQACEGDVLALSASEKRKLLAGILPLASS